jgi:hypothetical protein
MSVAVAAVVAVVLLLGAGVAHRTAADAWGMKSGSRVELPVPLSEIPTRIGGWMGEDLEIPAITRDYMRRHFADDFVSRRYVNLAEKLWADAYVVYCATRVAGILGHRPEICFPGHGWTWDSSVRSQFTTRSGREMDCLVHCFYRSTPTYQQVYVLNFYVLNGQITLSQRDFSGLFDRRPNLAGDPARYVAQVQISSTTEHATRALASQMADTILAFLPDRNGRVAVADDAAERTKAGEAAESDR